MSDLKFESVQRDDVALRTFGYLIGKGCTLLGVVLVCAYYSLRFGAAGWIVFSISTVLFVAFFYYVRWDSTRYDDWAATQRPYIDVRIKAQSASSRRNGLSMRRRVKQMLAERRKAAS